MTIEERLNALERRVQELEDKEAVRELRFRYHQYVNEGRFEEVAGLFTEDAVVKIGYLSSSTGRDEIHASFVAIPNNVKLLKQFIHNHIVEVQGKEATGISFMEAKYATKDGTSLFVAARYDERYQRTTKGWLISEMLVDIYFTAPLDEGWATENPHYLRGQGEIDDIGPISE